VQMPYGTSIEQTSAASAKVESWLAEQSEAAIVTAYVGQGAARAGGWGRESDFARYDTFPRLSFLQPVGAGACFSR